jgi:hypothetical protein
MAHPSLLLQMAKERDREVAAASRRPRPPHPLAPKARERLGWSLIGLGMHLAFSPGRRGQGQWSVARTVPGR